jgi:hypothetical protein
MNEHHRLSTCTCKIISRCLLRTNDEERGALMELAMRVLQGCHGSRQLPEARGAANLRCKHTMLRTCNIHAWTKRHNTCTTYIIIMLIHADLYKHAYACRLPDSTHYHDEEHTNPCVSLNIFAFVHACTHLGLELDDYVEYIHNNLHDRSSFGMQQRSWQSIKISIVSSFKKYIIIIMNMIIHWKSSLYVNRCTHRNCMFLR